MIPACRGGWCAKREKCARYRPGRIEQNVLDRVCSPKEADAFIPIYPTTAKEPQQQKEAAWPA